MKYSYLIEFFHFMLVYIYNSTLHYISDENIVLHTTAGVTGYFPDYAFKMYNEFIKCML